MRRRRFLPRFVALFVTAGLILPPQLLLQPVLSDNTLRNLQPASNSGLEEQLADALHSSVEPRTAGLEETDDDEDSDPDATVLEGDSVQGDSWSGEVALPGGHKLDVGAWRQIGFRPRQQDVYRVTPLMRGGRVVGCVLTLADGVSGVLAGETAARWVAERVPGVLARDAEFLELLEGYTGLSGSERRNAQRRIRSVHAAAVRSVHEEMATANGRFHHRRSTQESPGGRYGSTIVQALVVGSDAFVASVGDSRFQRIRRGRVAYQTRDDSDPDGKITQYLGTFLAVGHEAGSAEVDDEEMKIEPTIRYAPSPIRVQQRVVNLRPGDLLVIATDGVHRHVTRKALGEIGADPARPVAEVGREILDQAKGGADNRGLILARYAGPAAGMEERITIEEFGNRYGAQVEGLPEERRRVLDERLSRGSVSVTDVVLEDTLPLYAQGEDLFLAVVRHIEMQAPPGIRFDTRMLPVTQWEMTGVVLRDPRIREEPDYPKGLPVLSLRPEEVVADPRGAILAILRRRLGVPPSADVLVELFRDAQGRTHALIFA